MNFTKLAAISEIISSVAILITLIYLAIGINQNTTALQASSRDNVLNADLSFLNTIVEEPSIWLNYDKINLSDEEKVKLFHLLAGLTRIRERDWLQYQSGALDERSWNAYERSYLLTISRRQTRNFWNWSADNRLFDQSFTEHINSRIKEYPIRDKDNDATSAFE